MNKRAKKLIIVISMATISCMAITLSCFAFTYNYYRVENAYLETLLFYDSKHKFPSETRFYPEDKRGHFQFDAQTIFISLEQGKTEALVPFIRDNTEPFTPTPGVSWMPTEFLQVANALSERVWGEPLDLNTWYVRDMSFLGRSCRPELDRFNRFLIIYYQKNKPVASFSRYTARYIRIEPSIGLAEWAGDGDFDTLSLFAWKEIEFAKFNISVSDAIQIAEENGGKEMRENMNNECAISAYIRENPRRFYAYDWYVEYYDRNKPFSIFVNPFTGDVR